MLPNDPGILLILRASGQEIFVLRFEFRISDRLKSDRNQDRNQENPYLSLL